MQTDISSYRRNYMLQSHRRDGLIEWMREILNHSFVLNAPDTYSDSFGFFEDLINEHMEDPEFSRLKSFVPTVGTFHTKLHLQLAWEMYDSKYAVMELGGQLSLISFDGDQTLYSDGGNFENNIELADQIIELMLQGVFVAVVTAAGYGNDGSKYAYRLQGLLERFISRGLTCEEISRFYVFGGECNYLLRAELFSSKESSTSSSTRECLVPDSPTVLLVPVPPSIWQAEELSSPKPSQWNAEEIKQVLDIAEDVMKRTAHDLRLRAKVLRKERAVGIYPGGDDMIAKVPVGHGSNKLKREALDELVLRVIDELRAARPKIKVPYCVFNGGRDAWLDIGNKCVSLQIMQSFLCLKPEQCLHIGDQFLSSGNDYAVRSTCPCAWIISPRETQKILEHVLKFKKSPSNVSLAGAASDGTASRKTSIRTKAAALYSESPSKSSGSLFTMTTIETTSSKKLFDVYTGDS